MAKKIAKIKKELCLPEFELPPQKEDFRKTFQWRIFRIMAEFVDGFQFIADFKKSVAIFGSTRFSEKNPYYQEARKLGRLLAKAGYTVITGGGPGIRVINSNLSAWQKNIPPLKIYENEKDLK